MPPGAESTTAKLFVYGTLQRGFPLHEFLVVPSVRFLGEATTLGRLYDLGEYPGAVPSTRSDDELHGELYELRDAKNQLKSLDEVEEFDPRRPERSLFIRKETDVRLKSGERIRAWVYFLPSEPRKAPRIRSGDYVGALR